MSNEAGDKWYCTSEQRSSDEVDSTAIGQGDSVIRSEGVGST